LRIVAFIDRVGGGLPSSFLDLQVPRAGGLTVPGVGILKGTEAAVMIKRFGATVQENYIELDPIGSFSNTCHLSFFPQRCDGLVGMELRCIPDMSLRQGDQVILALPGFSVLKTDNSTLFSWNASSSVMTLYLDRDVAAHSIMSITLPQSSGIRLPSSCLATNQSDIKISVQSVNSFMLFKTIPSIEGIGMLNNTRMSFNYSYLNQPTEISLSVDTSNELVNDDSIELVLNNFRTLSQPAMIVYTSDPDVVGQASAISYEPLTLKFVLSRSLPAGANLTIVIRRQSMLALPKRGLLNEDGITLKLNARYGSADAQQIQQVQKVGVLNNTKISLNPAKASANSSVLIEFTPLMPLVPNDYVVLVLPGFVGDEGLISATAHGNLSMFQWAQSSQIFQFTVKNEIPSYTRVLVHVSEGFVVPSSGIRGDDSLTIQCFAKAGNTVAERLDVIQPVGAAKSTSLAFSQIVEGLSTTISVTLTTFMKVSSGDTIKLTFPNFDLSGSSAQAAIHSKVWIQAELIDRVISINKTMIRYVNHTVPSDNRCIVVPTGLNTSETVYLTEQFRTSDRIEENTTYLRNLIKVNDQLTIVFPFDYAANTSFQINISGFLFPGGKAYDRNGFTYEMQCKEGPVPPTAFESVPYVGYFEKVNLTFSDGLAGRLSTAALQLQASMTLRKLETIVVYLPGFTGVSRNDVDVLLTSSFKIRKVEWDNSTQELTLVMADDVLAMENFGLDITSVLQLPNEGIRVGETRFKVSTMASAGAVSLQSLAVQPVGSLNNSEALFVDPPIAAGYVTINISFIPLMRIAKNSRLTVRLNEFRLDAVKSLNIPFYGPMFDNVLWDRQTSSIRTSFNKVVEIGSKVFLDIPLIAGMISPIGGLTQSNGIQISIEGNQNGNLLPTNFTSFNHFGSFYSSPSLKFWPARAGIAVNIEISFVASMNIAVDELVMIRLTEFKGSYHSEIDISDEWKMIWTGSQDLIRNGVSIPNSTIVLIAKSIIPKDKTVQSFIPQGFGIKLPQYGVPSGFSQFLIFSNAISGPVLPFRITNFTPIGSFLFGPHLKFGSTCRAGDSCGVQVTLKTTMNFTEWDAMQFELAKLQSDVADGNVSQHCDVIVQNVSIRTHVEVIWKSLNSTFVVVFRTAIPAGNQIEFVIFQSMQLHVPLQGVRRNDMNYLAMTNASLGPISPVPFASVYPIGTFMLTTSLRFLQPIRPGFPSDMQLKLENFMELREGDSLFLHLKGFFQQVAGYNIEVTSTPADILSSVRWTADAELLQFQFQQTVSPNTQLSFVISRDSGLCIPINGVRSNDTRLEISSDAFDGPVSSRPLINVEPVGSFTNTSMIHFDPAIVDQVSNISVSFRAQMDLIPGDHIMLTLNGFNLTRAQGRSLSSNQSEFNVTNQNIIVDVLERIPALTEVVIFLPSELEIRLPMLGVDKERCCIADMSCCVLIGTDARFGPMSDMPLFYQQPVGSFKDSTTLDFFPPRVGRLDGIAISFTTIMTIYTGESISISLLSLTCTNIVCTSGVEKGNQANFSWNNETAILTFKLLKDIQADRQIVMNLPASWNLLETGNQCDNSGIRISTQARRGPVLHERVKSPGVLSTGSLQSTSLRYGKAEAGINTALYLEFVSTVTLYPGTNLTIKLPRFILTNSSQYASDWKISVKSENNLVTVNLNAQRIIPACELILVTIPQGVGIILPIYGLTKNFPGLTIASDAVSGASAETSIEDSPAFGAFLEAPALRFENNSAPVRAGAVTDIFLSFNLISTVPMGTKIILSLTDFGGNESSGFAGITGLQASLNWTRPFLSIVPLEDILNSTRVQIIIPRNMGISLPINGVRKNDGRFTMSVLSEQAPIDQVQLLINQPVGSFMTSSLKPSVTFNPPKAGSVSTITMSVFPQMDLDAGDTIIVRLPLFGFGIDVRVTVTSTPDHVIGRFNASSANIRGEQTILMNLTLSKTVAAEQNLLIYIDGLTIPDRGVRKYDVSIQIGTTSSQGPIPFTPFMIVQPVGAFKNKQVILTSFQVGKQTSIIIILSPWMEIQVGEAVSIRMPGFSCSGQEQLDLSIISERPGVNGPQVTSQWSSSTYTMTILFKELITAMEDMVFRISGSNCLIIPEFGVPSLSGRVNLSRRYDISMPTNLSHLMTISTEAGFGPVPPTILQDVLTPVGFFKMTRISFNEGRPVKAGQASTMAFDYIPGMWLFPTDTISLRLPGFRFASSGFNVSWDPIRTNVTATWNSRDFTLVMPVPAIVDAGTSVRISLPLSNGATIPDIGIRLNDPNFWVSTNAVDGKVSSFVVANVQPVGSFLNTARLGFLYGSVNQGKANAVNALLLSFTPYMPILQSENVFLQLPGFYAADLQNFPLQSHNLDTGRLFASWTQLNHTLTISFPQDVSANFTVIILIPTNMDIHLPPEGLTLNQNTLMIGSDAKFGPVPLTSIPSSAPVGSFAHSKISITLDCNQNLLADINVEFALRNEIRKYEVVTIRLPQFSWDRNASFQPVANTASGTTATVQISQTGDVVEVVLTFTANAQGNVSLVIPKQAGVSMPFRGVDKNNQDLTIASNAVSGPVLPTAFQDVAPVAAQINAIIGWKRICPGNELKMNLTVSVGFALNAGDVITVTMDTRSDKSAVREEHFTSGDLQSLSWDGSAGILRLIVGRSISPSSWISTGALPFLLQPTDLGNVTNGTMNLSIASAEGSVCPLLGLPWQLPAKCPTITAEQMVPFVSLTMDTPVAGQLSNFSVLFRLAFNLSAGSKITLNLNSPSLSDQRLTYTPVCTDQLHRSCLLSAVTFVSSTELYFTNNQRLEPGVDYLIFFQQSPISIPAEGLTRNSTSASISFVGAEFSYQVAIKQILPIGRFLASNLSTTPRIPNEQVAITLSFVYDRSLHKGDAVDFLLPGFVGPTQTLQNGQQAIVDSYWSNDTKVLSAVFKQDWPAMVLFTLDILVSNGLVTPAQGSPQNDVNLRVSTNASEGSVKWTPILHSAAILVYRCQRVTAQVPGGYCQGDWSLRVCATNAGQALEYANIVANEQISRTTAASCNEMGQSLCGSFPGGTFTGVSKDTCCQILGVEIFSTCAADSDCRVDTSLGTFQNLQVPKTTSTCCSYCNNVLAGTSAHRLCVADQTYVSESCSASLPRVSPFQESATCSTVSCSGYSLGYVESVIDPTVGGQVLTADNIGMSVPPNVWPPDAGPASVTLITDTSPAAPGQIAAGPAVYFGPTGLKFPEPGVSLSLPIDLKALPPGTSLSNLRVFKLVNQTWTLHPFGLVGNLETGVLQVKTLSFSQYQIQVVQAVEPPATQSTAQSTTVELTSTTTTAQATNAVVFTTPVQPAAKRSFFTVLNISLLAGIIGGVLLILVCCLARSVWLKSKSMKQAGMHEALLDSHSSTSSASSVPPPKPKEEEKKRVEEKEERMIITKEPKKPAVEPQDQKRDMSFLRPALQEIQSTVQVQSSLVMADGTIPPSISDSIDIEARLNTRFSLYPDINAKIQAEADLVIIDDSPPPSPVAASVTKKRPTLNEDTLASQDEIMGEAKKRPTLNEETLSSQDQIM